MEIAEEALRDDLGMTLDEFEGAYAMFRVGADVGELAKTFKCNTMSLSWFFIMRGAGDDERPPHWPGVE
jgi:hypothetical protein